MEQKTAGWWRGVSESHSGKEELSDYERACVVDDYVGLILANQCPVLVLNQEPLITSWYPIGPSEGIIVRCVWANDLRDVENTFEKLPSLSDWNPTGVIVDFESQDLVIFDSSSPGTLYSGRIDIEFPSGRFTVHTLFYEPSVEIRLLLHRLIICC